MLKAPGGAMMPKAPGGAVMLKAPGGAMMPKAPGGAGYCVTREVHPSPHQHHLLDAHKLPRPDAAEIDAGCVSCCVPLGAVIPGFEA